MLALRQLFGGEAPSDNLRIIITRHGERADLALGPHWTRKVQAGNAPDPRVSYLTRRAHFREWDFDPPLTVEGERQSRRVGRKLLELGCTIDYCYSSPAYRSIQTANKILEGQRRKAVPINIEPGEIRLHPECLVHLLSRLSSNRSVRMSLVVRRRTTSLHLCSTLGSRSTFSCQRSICAHLRNGRRLGR